MTLGILGESAELNHMCLASAGEAGFIGKAGQGADTNHGS